MDKQSILGRTLSMFKLNNLGEQTGDKIVTNSGQLMTHTRVRLEIVDVLRGFALIMMIAFHFCYDLNYFGWTNFPLGISFAWIIWQRAIASIFLLLVGISLVLRAKFKPTWRDFWQRWFKIAGAAIIVSLGSYLIFPTSFIYFGILHCISVSLLVGRVLLRLGTLNLFLGIIAIAISANFAHSFFNPRTLNWLGFATQFPFTEDYVPVFPWIGVVLIGCGLGTIWQQFQFKTPQLVTEISDRSSWLIWMGKRSLTIYLLHQPILFGMLFLIQQF
jgi:uncharacterized membrane protein